MTAKQSSTCPIDEDDWLWRAVLSFFGILGRENGQNMMFEFTRPNHLILPP